MMKQKDAVFAAISSVMTVEGNVQETITKEQRAQVNTILFESFRAGKINLDREFDDAGLKQYVSGLTSNWLRKDVRLNGGTKYQAKNPGSRAGSGDETLKAIRALKSTLTTDHADYAEVCQAESDRLAEIQAAKVTTTVNFAALPEALQAKFAK